MENLGELKDIFYVKFFLKFSNCWCFVRDLFRWKKSLLRLENIKLLKKIFTNTKNARKLIKIYSSAPHFHLVINVNIHN